MEVSGIPKELQKQIEKALYTLRNGGWQQISTDTRCLYVTKIRRTLSSSNGSGEKGTADRRPVDIHWRRGIEETVLEMHTWMKQ